MFSRWYAALALCAGVAAAPAASAVTLGQIDTFEDGTTQGWVIALEGASPPAAALPANVSTGGPAGVDDNYLRLTSTGTFGPGGKLTGINVTQWTGDFLTAGVLAISADVINLGASNVSLRLYVADPTSGTPTNSAISKSAIVVPSGSGWMHVVFPIAAGDLNALFGDPSAALAAVTELRILHSVNGGFPGEPSTSQIGIDNISAVPESGTGMLMGLGIVALGARRRRG